MKKQTIALVLAVALVIGCSMGGTMAWLTSKTPGVQNIFTTSDIDITLTETGEDQDTSTDGEQRNYKMIPGWTIDKDPAVTVKAGSEDCWVFIKVNESETPALDDYIEYEIDTNNWKPLVDINGNKVADVYVQTMPSKDIEADRTIKILQDNQVTVKDKVTKEMMNALTAENYPTLTFTAYATQYWKSNDIPFTEAEAWQNVQPEETPTP